MILYAPKALVKFRSTAIGAPQRLLGCVYTLYQGRLSITEALSTKEWAMIGSLGDGVTSGEIPRDYSATTHPDGGATPAAIHYKILEAGLRTQNYDKGFDKFVGKFERNEAMTATIAITTGWRDDHGWAVYCTRGPRRCLLLDAADGLSDEETLWTALAAWASFQPWKSSPRKYPGKLFYPTEGSHIFEKYWDCLPNLSSHPDFASESSICQERMGGFSRALAKMRQRNWPPKSVAEPDESKLHIAEDAALSRLRPIPYGPCQWEVHRQSADPGGTFQGADGTGSTASLG
jgi:hypothetical protein